MKFMVLHRKDGNQPIYINAGSVVALTPVKTPTAQYLNVLLADYAQSFAVRETFEEYCEAYSNAIELDVEPMPVALERLKHCVDELEALDTEGNVVRSIGGYGTGPGEGNAG